MSAAQVGGLRKHPFGRVDQLEDRYLGMVEAPSSNLGTSTSLLHNVGNEVAVRHARIVAQRLGHWLGTSTASLHLDVALHSIGLPFGPGLNLGTFSGQMLRALAHRLRQMYLLGESLITGSEVAC